MIATLIPSTPYNKAREEACSRVFKGLKRIKSPKLESYLENLENLNNRSTESLGDSEPSKSTKLFDIEARTIARLLLEFLNILSRSLQRGDEWNNSDRELTKLHRSPNCSLFRSLAWRDGPSGFNIDYNQEPGATGSFDLLSIRCPRRFSGNCSRD